MKKVLFLIAGSLMTAQAFAADYQIQCVNTVGTMDVKIAMFGNVSVSDGQSEKLYKIVASDTKNNQLKIVAKDGNKQVSLLIKNLDIGKQNATIITEDKFEDLLLCFENQK